MKTKLIDIFKKRVVLVDGLPKGASLIHVHTKEPILVWATENGLDQILLPTGNWSILSTLGEVREEDCEELVLIDDEGFFCWDYQNNKWGQVGFDPQESFLSGLEASGVLFENPIEPWGCDYKAFEAYCTHCGGHEILCADYLKWSEAQESVFSPNTLILVENV